MRTYRIEDITDGLNYPDSNGLNSQDEVVGDTVDEQGSRAFIERSVGTPTSATPLGAFSAVLGAINDGGVAVGVWNDKNGLRHAYIFDQNNNVTDLTAILGATQSWATDINNRGVIVGGVASGQFFDPTTTFRSFVYDPSALPPVKYLGALRGFANSYASAINNSDQVVGTCLDDTQTHFRPYLSTGGNLSDFSGQDGFAVDINDQGHILCAQQEFISPGGNSGPFVWVNGNIKWIPVNGLPSAINNRDQVVGSALRPDGGAYAFLYDNVVADLNGLIPSLTGLNVVKAYDINNDGHITAGALDTSSQGYALLLIPNIPRFDPRAVLGLVAQVTIGVKNDGGGLAFIGGQPVPVDPWAGLTESQVQLVFARATTIVEQHFNDDPEAQRQAIVSLHEFRRRFEHARAK